MGRAGEVHLMLATPPLVMAGSVRIARAARSARERPTVLGGARFSGLHSANQPGAE